MRCVFGTNPQILTSFPCDRALFPNGSIWGDFAAEDFVNWRIGGDYSN